MTQMVNRMNVMQTEQGIRVNDISQARHDAYINGLEAKRLQSELSHASQQLSMVCEFDPDLSAIVERGKANAKHVGEQEKVVHETIRNEQIQSEDSLNKKSR